MSNSMAVAAVTGALVNVLGKVTAPRFPGEPELSDAEVTSLPLDQMATDGTKNRLNVFLYSITPNAAWRGADPARGQRLEDQRAPLAINLHYLITAYAKGNDDLLAHRLLGRAMSLLHDFAVISKISIAAAIATFKTQLTGSDLPNQVERLRISLQMLTIDEMSKLWTMFQSKFRVSAVYQVTVVLIDSALSDNAALPVLSRGLGVQPSEIPPIPTLLSLTLPKNQPSARIGVPRMLFPTPPAADVPGDVLVFNGQNLNLGDPALSFFCQSVATTMAPLTLLAKSATALSVQLPLAQDTWPAGVYLATAKLTSAGPPVRVVNSNALAFTLAPRILSVRYTAPTMTPPKPATFTVTCSPQVWPSQRAALLVGDRELASDVHATKTNSLSFPLPAGEVPAPGTYFVRLRVDEVDSLVVSDYSATPPSFDTAQQVTVT